ncbi:MAG: tetratricopeptide repeat protein [Phycisphaerales bacterium]
MDPTQTFNQAQQAFAAGDWLTALSLFESVVKFDKKNEQIHTAMGFCAARLSRFDDGRRFLAKAVKLKPMAPEPHVQLGYLEAADYNNEKALAHYRRAVAVKPGHAGAVFGLVDVLRKQGEYDAAFAEIAKALSKTDEPDLQLADALALIAVKAGQQERAIELVREVLSRDLEDNQRAIMLYRLAGLLNDQDEYDKAFEAVLEGSVLKGVPWDTDGYDLEVERYLQAWTREAFDAAPQASNTSQQPVFVVGMPRSGTSLVEQIIASHPSATGVGELPAMVGIAGSLQMRLTGALSKFFTEPGKLTEAMLAEGASHYIQSMHDLADKLDAPVGAERIVDKQPHNFAHIPLIRLMFPEARIIYTHRDPRDTAVSCFFQGFDGPMGYCYDLFALGKYTAHADRVVSHARSDLGIDVLPVRYESLIEDPEGQIRGILDHIGLPFDEACLSFHQTKRLVRTASTDQVRQPIYKGSIGRWKRYESRLGPLLEGFKAGGFDPERGC